MKDSILAVIIVIVFVLNKNCSIVFSLFVPHDVRFIDALPCTPVGKVDFMSLTELKNV